MFQVSRAEVSIRVWVSRKRLSGHVKTAHGLTKEEYQARFPGALLEMPRQKWSAETKAKQSAAAKKRWSDPDARAVQSEKMKVSARGKGRLSDEHRDAISWGLTLTDKPVGRPGR